MNIILIGSMDDTHSRLTYQWFLDNEIQVEYVEVGKVPPELLGQGITTLPVVLLNGQFYTQGHDLRKLELLTHR